MYLARKGESGGFRKDLKRGREHVCAEEDTWGFIVGGPWSPQDLANQMKKCAGPEARRVASALHDGVHSGMIESTLSNFVHSLVRLLGDGDPVCPTLSVTMEDHVVLLTVPQALQLQHAIERSLADDREGRSPEAGGGGSGAAGPSGSSGAVPPALGSTAAVDLPVEGELWCSSAPLGAPRSEKAALELALLATEEWAREHEEELAEIERAATAALYHGRR
jgi:hypothetical protein